MPRRWIEIHFDPFSGNRDCHQWIDWPNWLFYWLFGGWAIWIDSGFDKQTFLLYGCVCVCVNDTGAISFYHLTLWVWHSLQCLGEIIWILNKFRISAWIICMCAMCVNSVCGISSNQLKTLTHNTLRVLHSLQCSGEAWRRLRRPIGGKTSLPPQTYHSYADVMFVRDHS